LYVLHQKGLNTDSFGPDVSLRLFTMVVIGGLGSLPGAILGAVYVRGAEFFLPPQWSAIASGTGILVLLMFMPQGLGGLMYGLRDEYLRRVAKRRGLLVPSLVADRREIEEDQAELLAAEDEQALGSALGGLERAESAAADNGEPRRAQATVEEERESETTVPASGARS
jgi:branched-chain amino acid transport system permease protein